jgi:non-specific serine/threonine protein kinase
MKKALALFHDLKNIYPLALTLGFFAGPVAAQGDPQRAAQLLGASDGLLKAMGLHQQPSDQPVIDRYEADVRQQLGEDAFTSAWEKGQSMSLEQAIAYVLDEEAE